MSLYDYQQSLQLRGQQFYALIMAAMYGADSYNIEKLRAAWPDVWAELDERYHAPGGLTAYEREREASA